MLPILNKYALLCGDAKPLYKAFAREAHFTLETINISVYTLRNWEQGRREPEGPAKVLLNVANYHPEVLKEMVL